MVSDMAIADGQLMGTGGTAQRHQQHYYECQASHSLNVDTHRPLFNTISQFSGKEM